ncbi:hypothetical protein BY996DRAFT_1151498 [Phakopsora pachyrhizi]|uniref:Expressed protein n=1 Tax=Phakopsora pachyrhizi TaxID=170000 RepID=A0AAV0BAJ6_PHAPC|nr:hypothetical protein BY996DRAFT_1151498 [Phakopsora pachyrhizi]CAH7682815.1 expressed protein [Phakopsora pachyrhizi]
MTVSDNESGRLQKNLKKKPKKSGTPIGLLKFSELVSTTEDDNRLIHSDSPRPSTSSKGKLKITSGKPTKRGSPSRSQPTHSEGSIISQLQSTPSSSSIRNGIQQLSNSQESSLVRPSTKRRRINSTTATTNTDPRSLSKSRTPKSRLIPTPSDPPDSAPDPATPLQNSSTSSTLPDSSTSNSSNLSVKPLDLQKNIRSSLPQKNSTLTLSSKVTGNIRTATIVNFPQKLVNPSQSASIDSSSLTNSQQPPSRASAQSQSPPKKARKRKASSSVTLNDEVSHLKKVFLITEAKAQPKTGPTKDSKSRSRRAKSLGPTSSQDLARATSNESTGLKFDWSAFHQSICSLKPEEIIARYTPLNMRGNKTDSDEPLRVVAQSNSNKDKALVSVKVNQHQKMAVEAAERPVESRLQLVENSRGERENGGVERKSFEEATKKKVRGPIVRAEDGQCQRSCAVSVDDKIAVEPDPVDGSEQQSRTGPSGGANDLLSSGIIKLAPEPNQANRDAITSDFTNPSVIKVPERYGVWQLSILPDSNLPESFLNQAWNFLDRSMRIGILKSLNAQPQPQPSSSRLDPEKDYYSSSKLNTINSTNSTGNLNFNVNSSALKAKNRFLDHCLAKGDQNDFSRRFDRSSVDLLTPRSSTPSSKVSESFSRLVLRPISSPVAMNDVWSVTNTDIGDEAGFRSDLKEDRVATTSFRADNYSEENRKREKDENVELEEGGGQRNQLNRKFQKPTSVPLDVIDRTSENLIPKIDSSKTSSSRKNSLSSSSHVKSKTPSKTTNLEAVKNDKSKVTVNIRPTDANDQNVRSKINCNNSIIDKSIEDEGDQPKGLTKYLQTIDKAELSSKEIGDLSGKAHDLEKSSEGLELETAELGPAECKVDGVADNGLKHKENQSEGLLAGKYNEKNVLDRAEPVTSQEDKEGDFFDSIAKDDSDDHPSSSPKLETIPDPIPSILTQEDHPNLPLKKQLQSSSSPSSFSTSTSPPSSPSSRSSSKALKDYDEEEWEPIAKELFNHNNRISSSRRKTLDDFRPQDFVGAQPVDLNKCDDDQSEKSSSSSSGSSSNSSSSSSSSDDDDDDDESSDSDEGDLAGSLPIGKLAGVKPKKQRRANKKSREKDEGKRINQADQKVKNKAGEDQSQKKDGTNRLAESQGKKERRKSVNFLELWAKESIKLKKKNSGNKKN